MASFLIEAFKGVKAEMEAMGTLSKQLQRLPTVLGILLQEILGMLNLIPYALTTMRLYRSLPNMVTPNLMAPGTSSSSSRNSLGVSVSRDVQFGDSPRTVLDVYTPSAPAGSPLPVIFFVHGGVWASGEKWHYAPMASRLAQEGFVVVVPTYELFPKALVPQMVREVSEALSWCFDHIAEYGGDASQISALGHSAGGHLVAMVIICRALAAAAATAAQGDAAVAEAAAAAAAGNGDWRGPLRDSGEADGRVGGESSLAADLEGRSDEEVFFSRDALGAAASEAAAASGAGWSEAASGRAGLREQASYLHGAGASLSDMANTAAALRSSGSAGGDLPGQGEPGRPRGGAHAACPIAAVGVRDGRMPALFVSMAGVYNIEKHYEFERARDVHELSMMKRAMGGASGFYAMSPSIIFKASAAAAAAAAAATTGEANGTAAPLLQPQLLGPVPSVHRTFELSGEAIPDRAGLASSSLVGVSPLDAALLAVALPVAAFRSIPPTVVMSSCADHMVPWHEGAELVAAMQLVGIPARHLMYNHVGHSDYVMSWKPARHAAALAAGKAVSSSTTATAAAGNAAPALKDFSRDLLKILRGQAGGRPAAAAASGSSQVRRGHQPQQQLEGIAHLSRL